MTTDSRDYLLSRERAERAAAKSAKSAAARRAHQELAQRYAAAASMRLETAAIADEPVSAAGAMLAVRLI